MPVRHPGPARLDACPGALRPHAAADGLIVRVRLPGGLTTPTQLRALADLTREFSDEHLELTSRANIQLRGLSEDSLGAVADRLTKHGLLPSASHERVRNILASPAGGHGLGGRLPVRPVVTELDQRLCAEPALAGLSGRFLFAIDDGHGDIIGADADIGLFPLSGTEIALLLAGADSGLRVAPVDAAKVLVAAARAFLAERADQGSQTWRIAGLVDGAARVTQRLRREVGNRCRAARAELHLRDPRVEPPLGLLAESAGRCAIGALVPLGRLSSAQAEVLARLGEAGRGEVVVTPWRTVLAGGLDVTTAGRWLPVLAEAGLPTDPGSAWVGVFACAGRPGCAKALADVRADAAEVVRHAGRGVRAVHWAGCGRQCGKPGDAVEVIAVETGYEVRAGGMTRLCAVDELAATVAAAREGAV